MDSVDRKILNILRTHARITNLKLAQMLHLTPSAALKRVRALERSGCITGSSIRVDHAKIGMDLTVLIEITAGEAAGDISMGKRLAEMPEICDVYDISGHSNYLVKAVLRNTTALNELIARIGRISGVTRTRTTLILHTLKNELSVELPEED